MRSANLALKASGAALAALAAGGLNAIAPAIRVRRDLGPDGTPFDPGRTTSKRTKRLAHLPERYAQAHQAKRKAIRRAAKHARRAT